MKIMAFSDLHLRSDHVSNDQYNDILFKTIKQITSTAKDAQPDIILIAGDLYDENLPSGSHSIMTMKTLLNKLSEHTEAIYLLKGTTTHDVKQSVFLMQSNKIVVVDKPRIITHNNCNLYFLPGFNRGTYAQGLSELTFATDNGINNMTSKDILLATLTEFAKHIRHNPEMPNIVVGHLSLDTVISEQFETGYEPIVPVSVLEQLGADFYIFGHIHRYQKIRDNIIYCGSLVSWEFTRDNLLESQEYTPHGFHILADNQHSFYALPSAGHIKTVFTQDSKNKAMSNLKQLIKKYSKTYQVIRVKPVYQDMEVKNIQKLHEQVIEVTNQFDNVILAEPEVSTNVYEINSAQRFSSEEDMQAYATMSIPEKFFVWADKESRSKIPEQDRTKYIQAIEELLQEVQNEAMKMNM